MNTNYLSDSKEQEMQIYLNSFLIIAKNNIEENLNFDDFQQFTSFYPLLNFWRNFSLNFKDESFVETLSRNEFNLRIINKILLVIVKFLEISLNNIDVFLNKVGKNNSKFAEVILIFYNLFQNICETQICNFLFTEIKQNFEFYLNNFMKFSFINLKNYSIVVFEKEGFAFLDFKGNFCKIIFIMKIVYADRYLSESIFECDYLDGKNFFDLLTDYSKFVIRKNLGNNFYDYKKVDCRIRELVFTIDLSNVKGNLNKNDAIESLNYKKKIIQILNNSKTLIGRFSTILLPSTKKDDVPAACILLEVRISKKRQNFDDFLWKQIFN